MNEFGYNILIPRCYVEQEYLKLVLCFVGYKTLGSIMDICPGHHSRLIIFIGMASHVLFWHLESLIIIS
jgi:hypothetical protein